MMTETEAALRSLEDLAKSIPLTDAIAFGIRDAVARIRRDQFAAVAKDAQPEVIETYFARQIEWSRNTFGPAERTLGVLDHIRKELREIAADPHDLSEWIDVVILAMDGFWRHGGSATDLLPRLLAKQQKNMARKWPDWRTMSEHSAIEHDRSKDAQPDAIEIWSKENERLRKALEPFAEKAARVDGHGIPWGADYEPHGDIPLKHFRAARAALEQTNAGERDRGTR